MVLQAVFSVCILAQPPVITEVAANPVYETSGEFLEIYNPSAEAVVLSGFSITDGDALDELVPWDESVHGTFPHSGMLLETDTLPPGSFALVFELDYPDAPVYDIPSGTLILTTADHSLCNGFAASSDPITLYNGGGTADSNAVSTYGTPVSSDTWQERDDDGLDGIPFDPGEGYTVERYPWSATDQEGSWFQGPQGGSPGEQAEAPPDTVNVSCDSVWTEPAQPEPDQVFQLYASFTCRGNTQPQSGTLALFLDADGDSTASGSELLSEYPANQLLPESTVVVSAVTSLACGWYLPSGRVNVTEDELPSDDYYRTVTAPGGGIDPVITEVLCNPLDEDTGEFIEIYYPGPGIFPMQGCSFTDGDALDCVTLWTEPPLADPDAVYGGFITAGEYGVILDSEYAGGTQEYDLAESTFVFTVENTTIGNGLTSNDPITFYSMFGTTQSCALSTYGTPLKHDDPLLCDDDGLDGIPFDPGEYHSVERKSSCLPDEEYCWTVSPEGGTPGGPAVFEDTSDVSADTLLIDPPNPQPGQSMSFEAILSNTGITSAQNVQITFFLDANADSAYQPAEVLSTFYLDSIPPGGSETVSTVTTCPAEGWYLAGVHALAEGDLVPENNVALDGFKSGEGVPLVVTEVLCNPTSEDNDEFVELYYPGPGVFSMSGCGLTDGDALDEIVPWDSACGQLSDPDATLSPFLLAGCYGVVLDAEYPQGTQPYDFPTGTVVFTTGNTTLGDGISGNDPISLYSPEGTDTCHVMSTYGTPLNAQDPLMRDDDELDGIPFDPGQDNSVQRKSAELPDTEEGWFASQDGPTPGAPPPFFVEGPNACLLSMECSPPMGPDELEVQLISGFTNTGTDTVLSGTLNIDFYADIDESGTPSASELLESWICGELAPGDTALADCMWNSCAGEMTLFSVAVCPADTFPSDDTVSCIWNSPGPLVVNEIMYAPSPGNPEWIEVVNNSTGTVQLCGWTIEDSKDRSVFCNDSLSIEPGEFLVITSDSSAFGEVWQNVQCPLLQPSSWPTLNNNTQSGENYADMVILRNRESDPTDFVPYDDDWGASQGVSLEKLDPDLPGWEASGWTGCSEGGTPGGPNSCVSGGEGSSGRFLHCYPDPFSPDGDGSEDVLTIEMNFSHQE
ncbi:MAG: hypothetical protein GF388_07795, partial [Candidatus Aegiribacteria sp.]|nr:hypothetical protein [Candidatus Aegiribacteria sp.]MBD3295019.1 hypothetical protein [Candidatus Fermentibacteria bacterium]